MNSIGLSRSLNTIVDENLSEVRSRYIVFPFVILVILSTLLYVVGVHSIETYIELQKDTFYYLNKKLANYANLQANLTELGDVVVFLPFLAILMVYAPKFWESLLVALMVCCVFSNRLKRLFDVPRPAGVFENDSFVIIGKTLSGNTSLPSGHAIAAVTILTVLLLAFMPKERYLKFAWMLFIFCAGTLIVFSRVGVGAHYPIDVVIGSIVGYISALIGIFVNERYNLLAWLTTRKYYPISIVLFGFGVLALVEKITNTNLIVCYLSLIALVAAIFIITSVYAKGQG